MTSMARTKGDLSNASPMLDLFLLGATAALLAVGLVMVASASLHLGERYGDPFHFVDRHLIALVLGLAAAWTVSRIPTHWWQKSSTALYFVGLLLLALVLVPGLGKEVNGATRWIALAGFNLQTSEFMKLFVVLYMAGYLVRRQLEVALSFWGFVKPLVL